MNALIESGLLWPLLAAAALLIAIVVVARSLAAGFGRRTGASSGRVEPHLHASRTGGGGAPAAYRNGARPTPAARTASRRRGFGWPALAVAFGVGVGAGVAWGGIIGAPGWDSYRPYVRQALAGVDDAWQSVVATAADAFTRLSDALAGDEITVAQPSRAVEVVGDETDPPATHERGGALEAFLRAVAGELPTTISPAIDLVDAEARNGNLALTLRVKRVVRERDRSLFVLTANERTRDFICNDTETTAIRALSDANVGVAITYVDASGQTIFEIDVLGGHCASRQERPTPPATAAGAGFP